MPVEEAPDDENVRQTYNFAPGNHGLVYRADVPDWGAGGSPHDSQTPDGNGDNVEQQHVAKSAQQSSQLDGNGDNVEQQHVAKSAQQSSQLDGAGETRYKLQSMKWGLVPFWTKRSPDYGSVMRTMNARDDSLAAKGGMWNTMKQRKRCIVVAQGFYEWLKKSGGKEKVPHFTKRKDGQLMCFAGLWDCVKYEGEDEKHYTYTIITTDSNKQLSFLHDRMPVILENGSEELRTWLDPGRSEWSKELQDLLKPFKGELECYPVSKEVGKVGNNSPNFVVPVASSENKHNIANFFGNAKKAAKSGEQPKQEPEQAVQSRVKMEKMEKMEAPAVEYDASEKRETIEQNGCTEDNAPLPVPAGSPAAKSQGIKREHEPDDTALSHDNINDERPAAKMVKTEMLHSPGKSPANTTPSKKRRSATSNMTNKESPMKSNGSQKITDFLKRSRSQEATEIRQQELCGERLKMHRSACGRKRSKG